MRIRGWKRRKRGEEKGDKEEGKEKRNASTMKNKNKGKNND